MLHTGLSDHHGVSPINVGLRVLAIAAAAFVMLAGSCCAEDDEPGGTKPGHASGDKPAVETLVVPLRAGLDDIDAPFLSKTVDVNFNDLPLIDAVQFLSTETGTAILLDEVALEEIGILIDEPMTLTASGLTLDRVLDVLLRPLGHREGSFSVTWYVEDGLVHITTSEQESLHRIRQVFNVAEFRRRGITADSLRNTIISHGPADWVETDGDGGTLSFVGNTLVVKQSYQAHRQLRALLRALAEPVDGQSIRYAEEFAAVEAALSRRIGDVNFQDLPLVDAAQWASHEIGHPVVVNAPGLEEWGLLADEPINLMVSGVTARTLFRLMLKPLDCTVVNHAGFIEITTTDVAHKSVKHELTAVYDLSSAPVVARRQVLRMIRESISRRSWIRDDENGEYSLLEDGLLVITQTEAVHAEIRELIAAWRQTDVRINVASGDHEVTIERRVYQLDLNTAEDLQRQIPQLISPESWKSPDNADGGSITLIRIGDETTTPRESGSSNRADKSAPASGDNQQPAGSGSKATSNKGADSQPLVCLSSIGGPNPVPKQRSADIVDAQVEPARWRFGINPSVGSACLTGAYMPGAPSPYDRILYRPRYSAALVVDQAPAVHHAIDNLLADLGIIARGQQPVPTDDYDSAP